MTMPPPFTSEQVTDAIRLGLCPRLRPGSRPVDLSPDDAHKKAGAYRASQVIYRQHTAESLARGDYRQTAEKSWGAYTQTVKAIAADHRLLVPTHSGVLRVSGQLTDLARQSGDRSVVTILTRGLIAARALHIHFYENDVPDDAVILSSADVATTIDLLQRLFPPEPAR